MEAVSDILSFPMFSTLILFMFLAFRIWIWPTQAKETLNLPPGPWKLPIIGNMHQLLLCSLPHRKLSHLAKKYGPVMCLQLGEVTNVIISSPEAAKEVMTTHDIFFAQRPSLLSASIITYGFTNVAFSPYGKYWRDLRKICVLELLSAKRVQSFRSIREEQVSNLISCVADRSGSPINLSPLLFGLSCAITSKITFGKKCKDQERFIPVIEETMQGAAGFSIGDFFPSCKFLHVISGQLPRLKELRQEMDLILDEIINEHKTLLSSEDGETVDLVHVLLNLENLEDFKFSLTTENIKAVIGDMFIAGTETSATLVEWTMAELMKNPRVMEKAQAEVRQAFDKKGNVDEGGLHELKYLKLVIKESMRVHPPLPLLLQRECREQTKICGYDIPAKSIVLINAGALAVDPNYWTDADKFYPERFLGNSVEFKGTDFQFIPFGAGRRMCPGILYGMAVVELQLAQLLYHFDWKLPSGLKPENLDMSEVSGISVRRKENIYLVPVPYR